MLIRARAPLRLGLAGGGTDVSPYCDTYGGFVLNGAIDRYAYAVIKPLTDKVVRFVATDQQIVATSKIEDLPTWNCRLALHNAVFEYMMKAFNSGKPIPMEVATFCDVPMGSGLGASSTLVVAMIRAYAELFNLPLDDYATARLAYKIERVDCGLQGGRQDQYSATFGGFNFMEFYEKERAVINPLRIKHWIICELEASLLLFYTGSSRESARIIADQSNNVKEGAPSTLNAMHGIKREAVAMKESLLRGDFSAFVESMREAWENKKRTAASVSNAGMDRIYQAALSAGALAGKVSGAGGGGYMLFFVPMEKRMDVIKALGKFGGHIENCHFTKHGSYAWRA